MHPPDLLLSNPPQLSEQLKWRTDELRSRIVRTNYNTQFAQTTPELAEFLHATAGIINAMKEDTLSESFQKTVQFTTYDSCAPFIARFFEQPCKESVIVNLFSPGLPDYLLESSSTSGGLTKWFPIYNCMPQIRSSDAGSDPLRRRTEAFIFPLGWEKIDVEDKVNRPATTIYLTRTSALGQRMRLYLDPEKDGEKMATFVFNHAAPYAAGFIKKWRPFLLIHALFAVGNRFLETMYMTHLSTFVDMIRFLDTEFGLVVDCITNGTIPDLDGITDVRSYLELNISPDPTRAAELRNLGRPSSRSEWCSHVWPNLRSVTSIASGAFASYIPLARWFLGPNVDIRPHRYACTEILVGFPYNPLEMNQYKPRGEDIIEFLDISESDSISSLAQLWEVELGRRYELVVTTQDGLWRYRLGDVVEISGFDPTDGVPIMQYIERRNVAIQFAGFMITEEELRAVMSSVVSNTLVKVVDWTTTIDDRHSPTTIGFLVELFESCGEVPDIAFATEYALDALSKLNLYIARSLAGGLFRKPTIRLVQSGTFSAFRQLKLDEDNSNLGQVKVPVVLPKAAYIPWFLDRVVREL